MPTRRPPSHVIKQRSLDDLDQLSLSPLYGKHLSDADPSQYNSDDSSLNKQLPNKEERQTRQLLESLDLQTPTVPRTREMTLKKVGEHFKKHTSALTRKLKESDKVVRRTPGPGKDSLTLLKPKSYQEALSPKLKLKRPKSEFVGQYATKFESAEIKISQAGDAFDKRRKVPKKYSDVVLGSSPLVQLSLSRSPPRPLLPSGQVPEKDRFMPYDKTNLSVLDNGSDSEDEIMV